MYIVHHVMVEISICFTNRLCKLYFNAKLSQDCFRNERHEEMYEFWQILRTKTIESNLHILGIKLHTSEEWRRPFSFLLASNPLIGRMLEGLGAARIPDVSGGDSSCSHCSAERIRRVQASKHMCMCVLHEARDPPTHVSRPLSLLASVSCIWLRSIRSDSTSGPDCTAQHLYIVPGRKTLSVTFTTGQIKHSTLEVFTSWWWVPEATVLPS